MLGFKFQSTSSYTYVRTSITLPVLLFDRRLDVLECLVVACSFFRSSILVMLDLFICPLAVRFCPDVRSRENSSFFGLSDLALGCTGWCGSRLSAPSALSCTGEARDAEEPCSWLDMGEKSGLLASGRLYCETSLEVRCKIGESESWEDVVSWVCAGSGLAWDRGVMEPDEVVWAVSAGCMTACCTSWRTPTGAVRVEVGCMVLWRARCVWLMRDM